MKLPLKEFDGLTPFLKPADVLLLAPPLASTILPAFGLHLLQASCREVGIEVTILYTNFLFRKLIGDKFHAALGTDDVLLLGEFLFATAAFDYPPDFLSKQWRKFLEPNWVPDHVWKIKTNTSDSAIPNHVKKYREYLKSIDIEQIGTKTIQWVNWLSQHLKKGKYPIIGCSNTYGGLVPPLALLKSIKKNIPETVTILGGALCEAEMAEGLLSINIPISYIFSGEGELSFPKFSKQILSGQLIKDKILVGQPVKKLDRIPLPDYSDFIQQKESNEPFAIPYETSRGCWHGNCTFCALNGKVNLFRCKSQGKILKDIDHLENQHKNAIIAMTDNMMPLHYFDTLIPHLDNKKAKPEILFEIQANLTLRQVIALKKARINFRPGIESLSSSLLSRMRKPTNGHSNIKLLRYARSMSINLEWALLIAVPGDQIDEYQEMLSIIPLLRHLPPPSRIVPLILYRFSQYQQTPEAFSITGLKPASLFSIIFPEKTDLDKLAYYFTADYSSAAHENPSVINALWKEFTNWQTAWDPYKLLPIEVLLPSLHIFSHSKESNILEDTRGIPGQPVQREINQQQTQLLLTPKLLNSLPNSDLQWALDSKLGLKMGSWFIPLATADVNLLQEIESKYTIC